MTFLTNRQRTIESTCNQLLGLFYFHRSSSSTIGQFQKTFLTLMKSLAAVERGFSIWCLPTPCGSDIPAVSSFVRPRKAGYLKKLTGRGWFSSGYWKKRYCVLDGTKLYFYEDETSKANEKTAGTISLDYYDLCEEGTAKDTKRISNVFTVGTSVRGFFDNRHLFAAEAMQECQEWMKEIRDAIEEARYHRSRAGRSKIDEKKEKQKQATLEKEITGTPDQLHIPESADCLPSITKDRVKGPIGRRLPQRKSLMPMAKKPEFEERKRPSSLPEETEEDSGSEKIKSQRMDFDRMNESHLNVEDGSSDHETSLTPQSSITPRLSPKPRREKGALLLELENKVVTPKRRTKIPSSYNEKELDNDIVLNVKNSVEAVKSRMEILGNQIDRVEKDVTAMRQDMRKIQEQIHISSENDAKITEEAAMMENRMEEILKEVHLMFEKSQEALQEAQEAKKEYCNLKQEFEEILMKIKSHQILPPSSSVPNVTD